MSKRTHKKRVERGRWTSQRKQNVVLRLLRGEDLQAMSASDDPLGPA